MSKQWLLLIFTTLLACGKVSDQPAVPMLDEKAVATAEKLYCTENQSLREDRASVNVTFDKLAEKSQVFAFSNTNGGCALTQDIQRTWPSDTDPMFFNLLIHWQCLPNNSVWIATPSSTPTEQKYVLHKVGDAAWPAMEMTGSKKLAGSFVSGATGLMVLVCQQK